jgi:Zn-finger nucleic acid-binding protein
MSRARLLKRIFDIEIEHCPNCGGACSEFEASDAIRNLSRASQPLSGRANPNNRGLLIKQKRN